MKEGAPQIHDTYANNINIHVHIDVGDVDKAMDEAYLVREDTFKAAGEAYAMMEPYAVVASYANGLLDLWMQTLKSPLIGISHDVSKANGRPVRSKT